MKRIAMVMMITLALVLVGAAQAHYGDRWFTDKASITKSIEAKYRLNVFRTCLAAHDSHVLEAEDGFGPASYDHFVCLVTSEVTNRTCWTRAHIVGSVWTAIVLTSDRGTRTYKGCGPPDIRRRAGY